MMYKFLVLNLYANAESYFPLRSFLSVKISMPHAMPIGGILSK